MSYTCSICGYTSSRAFNYNRHLKTHEQLSNRASEHSLSTREHSPSTPSTRASEQLSKRAIEQKAIPTLEHISDNIVRVDEHNTDKDILSEITDEVSQGARALNRVNKAIPQRKMRQLVDSNQDTGSKISAKTVIGMIAFIIGIYLIWHFRVELMSLITNLKLGERRNTNSYGFSIERY